MSASGVHFPLYITELPQNDPECKKELKKHFASCEKYANEKMRDAEYYLMLAAAYQRKPSANELREKELFKSSYVVNRMSFFRITGKGFNKLRFSLCYDDQLNILGFALYRESLPKMRNTSSKPIPEVKGRYLYLIYLSSTPKNLTRESRIHGVGATLISSLQEKCVREGFSGIFVDPRESAVPYFKNLGFEPTSIKQAYRVGLLWQPSLEKPLV